MTVYKIRKLLITFGDPKRHEQIRYYFNHTGLKMYGVNTGDKKRIARNWLMENKKTPPKIKSKIVRQLYLGESFDEKILASFISDNQVDIIKEFLQKDLDLFIKEVDNWAVSDCLSDILAQWVLISPKPRVKYLKQLIKSKNLWARRQALVVSFYLNFTQSKIDYSQLVFELVEKTKHEKHPMIVKAVSWALRGLVKYHSGELRNYLKINLLTLPSLARREVVKKLETGKKN